MMINKYKIYLFFFFKLFYYLNILIGLNCRFDLIFVLTFVNI